MEDYTRRIFARGQEIAAKQGLILVDTKYEFGKRDGKVYLIDEIHTPDSSATSMLMATRRSSKRANHSASSLRSSYASGSSSTTS